MTCSCMDMLNENNKKKYIILNERLAAINELKVISIVDLNINMEMDFLNRKINEVEHETREDLKQICNCYV